MCCIIIILKSLMVNPVYIVTLVFCTKWSKCKFKSIIEKFLLQIADFFFKQSHVYIHSLYMYMYIHSLYYIILAFIICSITMLNPKIKTLNIQFNIRKNQLLFYQLPNNSMKNKL